MNIEHYHYCWQRWNLSSLIVGIHVKCIDAAEKLLWKKRFFSYHSADKSIICNSIECMLSLLYFWHKKNHSIIVHNVETLNSFMEFSRYMILQRQLFRNTLTMGYSYIYFNVTFYVWWGQMTLVVCCSFKQNNLDIIHVFLYSLGWTWCVFILSKQCISCTMAQEWPALPVSITYSK